MRQADRIIVNVLSNYGLTLVGGLASLVMVPIVISELGSSGYGLATILLATYTITKTLGQSINRSLYRYLPLDLASKDDDRLNITFNSAMACYAILGLIAAAVIWSLRHWLLNDPDLGAELIADATWTIHLVCIGLLITAPMWSFQAGLESIQRFDIVVVQISVMTVVRTLAIIIIFKVGYGSVTVFVVSLVVTSFATYLLCRRSLRKSLPQVSVSPRMIRADKLKLLAVFTGGGLLISAGNLLGLEGFRLLIGKGLSMEAAGGLSAVWALRAMVVLIISSVTNVLTPAVSAMDAKGSSENVAKLLLSSNKYSAVAASSIGIVPLAVADSILKLWLGDEFLWLVPLMYTVMGAQLILAMSSSAQQVLVGLGRMRLTGPMIFIRGAGGLAVAGAYLFLSQEPTLLGAAICLYAVQIICSLIIFMYGSAVTNVSQVRAFAEGLGRPLMLASLAACVTWMLASLFGSDYWWTLLLCITGGEVVFVILVLTLGMNTEERSRLLDFAGRVRVRFLPSRSLDDDCEK